MLERLVPWLIRRLRPAVGWPIATLALAAAAAPGVAARDAGLRLPDGPILWAGLLGAALGLRMARPAPAPWRALRLAAWAAIGLALLVAAGGAAPPRGLLAQDLAGLAARLAGAEEPPAPLTGRYLALALPRLWRALVAAPGAGEAGAALIVAGLSMALTYPGATLLGWATGALRPGLGWGVPMLLAMALTTILGGAGGAALVIGVGLLLGLALAVGAAARERVWEREGYAYSELLRPAALGWGGATVAVAIAAALLLPTSLPNLAASLPDPELPSGLAAIEGQVRAGQPTATPNPAASSLPAIVLGVSLEQAPRETLTLRIEVDGPLPPGPHPRYWRARVLNLYTGTAWTTNALRAPFGGLADVGEPPPGAIVQRVEDLRGAPELAFALPNPIGLDQPAVAERLPDGSLAALEVASARYTVVSLPQELAAPEGGAGGPPPSHADTLGLPASVTQRVRDLAATVAGREASPMAQALALEAYLRRLPYSYEVRPLPRRGDAVDQFLFEMGHGYCTYYASAMAVMARSLGIPARVAVGYATGEYDAEAGAYLVREGDAHAWPELLIGGRWLAFEPTPVRPLPARAEEPPAPTPAPAPAPEPRPAPPLGALGLAAAAAAGLAWLAWRLTRRPALERAQLRLERMGRRAGVPWPPGATLQEYGRLLAERGASDGALAELIGLIEGARYGRRPLGPEQARRLARAEAAVRDGLRRGRDRRGTMT